MSPRRKIRPSPDAENTAGEHPQPPAAVDHFDRLPDSLLLLILGRVSDMEYLTRCLAVSRRFRTIVPQIRSLLIRLSSSTTTTTTTTTTTVNIGPFHRLASQISASFQDPFYRFHNPQQCPSNHDLRNFPYLRTLRMEAPHLPQDHLLLWKAHFDPPDFSFAALYSGTAPGFLSSTGSPILAYIFSDCFYMTTDFLHPIIAEHPTMETLVLIDAAPSQWKLTVERSQVHPEMSVHDHIMRMWHAPRLELPTGIVLEEVQLVVIQTRDGIVCGGSGDSFSSTAFEEPYGAVARMLMMKECCLHTDFSVPFQH